MAILPSASPLNAKFLVSRFRHRTHRLNHAIKRILREIEFKLARLDPGDVQYVLIWPRRCLPLVRMRVSASIDFRRAIPRRGTQVLWGSIGWATPAAFGIALADPERRTILITAAKVRIS